MTAHETGIPSLTIDTPETAVSNLNDALQILAVVRPLSQPRHEVEKCCIAVEVRITNALKLMVGD